MATPLRKKRNFRGLQLQVSDPPNAPLPPPPPIPPLNLTEIQPLVIRKTPIATNPPSVPSASAQVKSPSETQGSSPASVQSQPSAKPPGKKRPPPMTLKAPKLPPSNINVVSTSAAEDNLTVVNTAGANSAPNTASFASGRRNTYHAHLSNALANLDMNAEMKFELKAEDLKDLQELGQGNGGSVKKVEHVPTGTIMAKKVRRCFF